MAFNGYLIAEAYATLAIDERKFNSGLKDAGQRWSRFVMGMNSSARAFGQTNSALQRFTNRVNAAKGPVDSLTKSMNNLAKAANAANRALGGRSMTAYLGGIKAWGTAVASIARGVGSAFASVFRGIGAGMGSILGGLGRGIGNTGGLFKGIGAGISSILRGVGSGLSSIIRSAGSASNNVLRGISSLVGGVTRPLMAAVGSLKGLAIGGLIAGGIGGLGAAAMVSNAADIELSFARIRRSAEFTDNEFKWFKRDLLAFGNATAGVKLDSLFEIANVGAKIGVSGDQLNLFTRDMAKVRVAISEQDIPKTELAERIGSLISVFHRGNDEAIKFASALNALDLKSTASARDILDVSGRMSGTASLLGMKPHEVLALSTALRQARVPIETAGTAMQQIMGRMASRKDSPQFARIAGMKEKSFLNLVGSDPLKAIIKIEEGLHRLDKITAIRALDQLGLDGQRVRGTLLQLGTVLPQLNDYVKVSEHEWKNLTSIFESNAIIGNTMHAQWEKIKTNFATMSEALGKHLLPVLKTLASAFEGLMYDIRAAIEANGGVFETWAKLIADKLKFVGVLWRNWGDFIALGKLKWWAFIDTILQVADNLGTALWDNLKWSFSSAVTYIKDLFLGMASFMAEIAGQMGKSIGVSINNALVASMPKAAADALGLKKQAGVKIGATKDHFADVGATVKDAPGFAGILNVPMNGKRLKNMLAQAVIGKKIDNAVAGQQGEIAGRRDAMDAEDADVRRRGDMLRNIDDKPEKRKKRGADLSVLRPGFRAIDQDANDRRQDILDTNRKFPGLGVAVPRDRSKQFGPNRGVMAGVNLAERRARMAVPLALRGTEFDPNNRDFMGPRREAAGMGIPQNRLDTVNRSGRNARMGADGSNTTGARWGRSIQNQNAQFREWRRQQNAQFRGRSLRRSGNDNLPPGTREKEKGVEEVLTEAKAQTTELREIKTALVEIKNKGGFIT